MNFQLNIDETKLPQAMELIDLIAEPENSDADRNAALAQLRILTGNMELKESDFFEYWGYTSLEEIARKFLLPAPQKYGMSKEIITDLIRKIQNAEFPESENDYWLSVLELETGHHGISDDIYWSDMTAEEIAEKALAKKPICL